MFCDSISRNYTVNFGFSDEESSQCSDLFNSLLVDVYLSNSAKFLGRSETPGSLNLKLKALSGPVDFDSPEMSKSYLKKGYFTKAWIDREKGLIELEVFLDASLTFNSNDPTKPSNLENMDRAYREAIKESMINAKECLSIIQGDDNLSRELVLLYMKSKKEGLIH